MKALPALLMLPLLAACGAEASRQQALAADEERIECALGGAESFERACTLEQSPAAEGALLTVRHPDGGFRRLLATAEGVAAADGAEQAMVEAAAEDAIEVTVGGDRYRLPPIILDQ